MTSAPRPRSGWGSSGNHGDCEPAGRAVGGSTEAGNHDNRGPLPRPPPHPLRLLGRCCKPLQQGCTAGCRADCRTGSHREAVVGLGGVVGILGVSWRGGFWVAMANT